MGRTVTQTKVTTLADLKDRETVNEVVLSVGEYNEIIQRFKEVKEELESKSEESDIQEIEILELKNELKNLIEIINKYKKHLDNKEKEDLVLSEAKKIQDINNAKLKEDLFNRIKSKHTKRNKEDLEALAKERLNAFKNELDYFKLF